MSSTLPELSGFDLPDALHRLRGKWERLRDLIISFADANRDATERLRTSIAAGHLDDAQRLCHQLKGSGANLGAVEISAIAADIEAVFKSGGHHIDEQLISRFSHAIDNLNIAAKILRELRDQSDVSATSTSDLNVDQRLNKILDNLHRDLGAVQEDIKELRIITRNTSDEDFAIGINNDFENFRIKEVGIKIKQRLNVSKTNR